MKRSQTINKFINPIKKKRLIMHKRKADFYQLVYTAYGEPVLIGVIDAEDSSLTIQLLYTNAFNLYRATFWGNFIADEMVIADVKVLDKPSYSPKSKKPFSKGYGSLLMMWALEEAKKRNATIVTGERVSFDEEQKNRQINYYSKFGFSIDSNNKLFKKL